MNVVCALLSRAIDYAGMFPPAGLDLRTTIRNYEMYRAGKDAWALGALILPARVFGEFAAIAPSFAEEWPISLLLGDDFAAEIEAVESRGFVLNAVECRPKEIKQIEEIRRCLPEAVLFVEAPIGVDSEMWLAAIAEAGACAKIRMGGVKAEAIPAVAAVTNFVCACAEKGVRLKATAGMHHALRGEHALTCEPGCERAVMHGFVNFFAAATVVYGGGDAQGAAAVLEDDCAMDFQVVEGELRWRERRFSREQIEAMREGFVMSFGSCSFSEPLDDMRALGWLQ